MTCSTLSLSVFVLDEEIIFRSWDGDILKANTHSNETELLLKNTTFVSFFKNVSDSSSAFIYFRSFSLGITNLYNNQDASINKMTPSKNKYFREFCMNIMLCFLLYGKYYFYYDQPFIL